MLPLDPKFNLTLCRMNIQNYHDYIDDEIDPQFPPPIDTHNRVVVDNPGEGNPRRQPPTQALKSTTWKILTSLTLVGHFYYLLYHMVKPSW